MIKCKYCDSYLIELQSYIENNEKFCPNCNCGFYFKNNNLIETSFGFYLNEYYFGISLYHAINATKITGTHYGKVNYNKIDSNRIGTKKFEKTFNSIINITPQNATQKVKLYMLFS